MPLAGSLRDLDVYDAHTDNYGIRNLQKGLLLRRIQRGDEISMLYAYSLTVCICYTP